MEQALYHPEHGYYSSDRATIGRRGDYFTNVSVGPLFGQLLGAQFFEIWERLGKIGNFTIVEQGAHHGEFARDVLEFSRERFPEFFSAIRYVIVEPFPKLQDRQSTGLKEFGASIRWVQSLDQLEPFTGVHFSNELLDAMPINLRNKMVALRGGEFAFVDSTVEHAPNQSQLDWIDNVATRLQRGFVLAIDYGFARDQWREMIQVRAQHRQLDSPFAQIGEADITAHVNWTDIAERAETKGLRVAGFTDQHHFLTGIISTFPEIVAGEKFKRALQTLLHPEMLGRSFQVLALAKDVDLVPSPSGFKFARDAHAALAL
ncbi:MAG TPA: SAM-dependent methyltransferase [Chthoniobacterales bacterium]|jgi:SAM-dependent MidA family methyltransferase|nr:SAM-dependent methyltransferase [Chthoniobacterales bacterium]